MGGYLYVISIVNMLLNFLSAAISKEFGEKQFGADGEPTAPKDVVFYKGKIYWLHVKITSEEYTSYVYRM